MKKLVISLILLPFFLASCKKKPINNTDNESKVEEVIVKKKVERLLFTKSPCYGECPHYTATILPNGKASIKSIAHTSLLGTRVVEFKPETIDQIIKKIDAINFFELDSIYDNKFVTDIPSSTLTITTNKGVKSVMIRYDMPDNVREYYNFIHTELMLLLDVEAEKAEKKAKNRPVPAKMDNLPNKKGAAIR